MGTETLIVFLTCGFVLLVMILSSWYRRKKQAEKETGGISRIHETVINGQRTFRIATVARQAGQLTMNVYEIRLPRANDPNSVATITLLPPPPTRRNANIFAAAGAPPPPFSTAINMPSPSSNSEDISTLYLDDREESPVPPPRYDQVIQISTISGNKIPEENASAVSAPTLTTA